MRWALLVLCVTVTSCGGKDSDDSGTLDGTWRSACLNNGDGTSEIRSLVVQGNSSNMSVVLYRGTTCVTAKSTNTAERTFTVGEAAPSVSGARKIDYVAGKALVKFHTQEVVDEANQKSIYGYTDWRSDEPKQVNGRKFDANSSPVWAEGLQVLTIFKVDGNKWTPADETTGTATSDATRPTSLHPTIFYTRQ